MDDIATNTDFSIPDLFAQLDLGDIYAEASEYIDTLIKNPDIETYSFQVKEQKLLLAFDRLFDAIQQFERSISACKVDETVWQGGHATTDFMDPYVINKHGWDPIELVDYEETQTLHDTIQGIKSIIAAYGLVVDYNAKDDSDAAVYKYVMETLDLRKRGSALIAFEALERRLQQTASAINANYDCAPSP